MVTILYAVVSIFVFRFRSSAVLELKLVALQRQLAVLRRQRPGRPQLSSLDRLLWVLLYRIWPQVIDAMVLVKPATVVEWHRKGFRFYWRWRSRRPGRPRTSPEIRDLIRRMSNANPLWGAPRIHGELLKLGIKISQATVGRWMPWRPKVPSPTWRSFLRNQLPDTVAIDMFVVATATFYLLYTLIVLSLDRRRVIHFAITPNPTQDAACSRLNPSNCRHVNFEQGQVFGGRIFVPRQQFLVHRPRDVGQNPRQLHESPLPFCPPTRDGRH